jgi:hypothetical protein
MRLGEIKLQGNMFVCNLQGTFTYIRETSLYSTRSLTLWSTIPRVKYGDERCIPANRFWIPYVSQPALIGTFNKTYLKSLTYAGKQTSDQISNQKSHEANTPAPVHRLAHHQGQELELYRHSLQDLAV